MIIDFLNVVLLYKLGVQNGHSDLQLDIIIILIPIVYITIENYNY